MIFAFLYLVFGLVLFVLFRQKMMDHADIKAFRKTHPQITDTQIEGASLATLVIVGPILFVAALIMVIFKMFKEQA